jgi:hypothetical protein
MNKIPVGKTISFAYTFAFGSLGTIIGLVWLPLVILTLLNFLPGMAGASGDPASQSPVTRLSEGIGSLAVFLLSALLYAVIYTAVTRQALGLRRGSATIHFALGMPEFRMFGAVLVLIAVTFVLLTTYFLVVVMLASARNPMLDVAAVAFAVIGGLALVYALVRLSFLLIPVTVAEDQVSLLRSWTLSSGNFLRIFAVLMGVAVPIIAVFAGSAFALMAKDLLAPIPASVMNNQAALVQHLTDIFSRHGPELIGLQLVLAPFSLGLNLGSSAFAYRAIVQDSVARPAS